LCRRITIAFCVHLNCTWQIAFVVPNSGFNYTTALNSLVTFCNESELVRFAFLISSFNRIDSDNIQCGFAGAVLFFM
jgi:hypothetical protein